MDEGVRGGADRMHQEGADRMHQDQTNPNDMGLSVGVIRHYWTVFAEAFSAEARERSAPFTRFPVASFF